MKVVELLHKAKNNKTLINGGLFSLYSFMGRGISFLLLILLANYIPPAEYGVLSLFSTVVSFVTIFMALNSEGYFNISYFKKSPEEFKKDFSTIYSLGLGTVILFLIIIFIGGNYISEALELSQQLLVYAVIISFFAFSSHVQQNFFRIQEKVITYGIYNIGNALINFCLSLFFVITYKQGWMGRVNAQLICTVVFGFVSIYTFTHYKLFKLNWEKDRYREIISWGLPMIPHHATGWIRQGLDRYIINYYYTTYQVGIFSYAINISNIIDMIGIAFNATNSVTLYQTLSNKELTNQQKIRKLDNQTRLIGIIYLIATIVVAFSITVLTYVALPQYRDAMPYIGIMCVAGFLKCVYYLYCNYLFYYSKTKNLMFVTFGTSILHLVLSLALTGYSLYFTAIIYTLVQAIMTVLVYLQSKRLLIEEFSK